MAKEKATSPQSKTASTWLWVAVLLFCMIWISFPTVMMVAIAMPPTLVAWIIDRTYQKSATYCVASLNFCGLFPYLVDLWLGTHSIKAAGAVMSDVFTLLAVYGSAAFGWMMFIAIPPVVATFLTVISQRRVAQLRALQREIIDEWGEGVAGMARADAGADGDDDDES